MSDEGASWEPVVEETADALTPAVAAAMHGLLDAPGAPPGPGDPVPLLWHWLTFLPRTPQRDLGPDGHPRPGSFLPPASGRRMFAGGQVSRGDRDLRVGEELARRSVVTGVREKTGRSGSLVFVTVNHELSGRDGLSVTDVQDIVYRPPAPPPSAASAAPAANPTPAAPTADIGGAGGDGDDGWDWGLDLRPDPTLLFRFSALTYNAHRIHYDRTYATEVEGYPGLVVHGPLQAIALAELCRRNVPGRPLRTFRFRAVSPAFDGRPLRFRGRWTDDDQVTLVALDDTGVTTMEADATL